MKYFFEICRESVAAIFAQRIVYLSFVHHHVPKEGDTDRVRGKVQRAGRRQIRCTFILLAVLRLQQKRAAEHKQAKGRFQQFSHNLQIYVIILDINLIARKSNQNRPPITKSSILKEFRVEMLAVNKKIPIFAVQHGAISSVGRAPDCGSGCRGFEPHIAPQLKREDDRQVFVILCFFMRHSEESEGCFVLWDL